MRAIGILLTLLLERFFALLADQLQNNVVGLLRRQPDLFAYFLNFFLIRRQVNFRALQQFPEFKLQKLLALLQLIG